MKDEECIAELVSAGRTFSAAWIAYRMDKSGQTLAALNNAENTLHSAALGLDTP